MASEPTDSRANEAGLPEGVPGNGSPADWLVGGGELGELIRATDWSRSSFGSRDRWPESLRTAVNLLVASRVPMCLLWGPELRLLYNDGYRGIAAERHPNALGRPMRDVWPEIWPDLAPVFAAVMEHGESFVFENRPFRLRRRDAFEDAHFTLSYAPVRVEGGAVGGVLALLQETTAAIESRRLFSESEARLRSLIDLAPYGAHLYELDHADRLVFVGYNKSAESILGVDHAQFIGKTILEAFPAAAGSELPARYAEVAKTGRPWETDASSYAHGGISGVFEVRAVQTASRRMVAFFRDITERKRAEELLRSEQELMAKVLDTQPDTFFLFDGLSGKALRWNRAFRETSGYSDEEIAMLPAPASYYGGDDLERARVAVERLLQGREESVVIDLICKDGRRVPTEYRAAALPDERGIPRLVISIGRDITERKRAEDALREASERQEAILGALPDLLFLVDTEGRILDCRAPEPGLLYVTPEKFMNRRADEVLPPEAAVIVGKAIGEAVENGTSAGLTYSLPMPGGLRWFELSVAAQGGRGCPGGRLIVTARDVTERKLNADTLREADRRKDEFLAVLSHELRNPLAPIRNSLYVLDHAAPGGEQAQRAQVIIGRQVAHLTHLVDELLDVTRIARGKIKLSRERLDLNELTERTVEDHRGTCEASGLALELDLAPVEAWIGGDRLRLAQAIGNLLLNAEKFTPRGGSVAVSVEMDLPRAQAILTVRDTGAGIAPEMMARLFEPFAQADLTLDRSKGGLGLGLALVKGAVEMHGGSVSAVSEGVGKGAEFTIRLPLEAAPAQPRQAQPRVQGATRSPRRVLVIEDNVDAADSLREVLELSGHMVVMAHDGPTGVERARALRPDVVLCDIGLPGMDGYAAARALRADPELGSTTLVALTGYTGPEDVAKSEEAGFDAHIGKPPSIDALEEVLATSGARGE